MSETLDLCRAAVIDCGSNMFTMLIAEGTGSRWERKHVLRHPVFIGQGGFQNRSILPDRFARGMDVLGSFHQALQNYGVDTVRIVGTSALRDANNGRHFAQQVQERFGWKMDIIDGESEARWIHRGVAATMKTDHPTALIMDIGGGSVEFIMTASQDDGSWKEAALLSLDAGVARLEEFGKPGDPLGQAGSDRYVPFLEDVMAPLVEAIALHRPTALVGSSGSFDTFAEAVNGATTDGPQLSRLALERIDSSALHRLHLKLLNEPHERRLKIPGMAPARARMIPLSSMLVQFVLGKMDASTEVLRSPYAMREGLMDAVWQHLCTSTATDLTNETKDP